MILPWDQSNIKIFSIHLLSGEVAVIPTDTLYGTLAIASDRSAVEKVYSLKGRQPEKPCIILISNKEQLKIFDIKITDWQDEKLHGFWPGPVSVILECDKDEFAYLHRGTFSLAFRLPNDKDLVSLIENTGPLIAPSANPEGLPTALDVNSAKEYFGDRVSLYAEAGQRNAPPSTLVSLVGNKIEIIRGSLKTKNASQSEGISSSTGQK